MNWKRIWSIGMLGVLVVATSACVSRAQSPSEPTPITVSSPTAAETARITAIPQATETPRATAVPPTALPSTATATAVTAALEEDCMAGCHPPDPNEMIAAGAGPMPMSHQGRTTCLECHAQGKGTALPDTHLGRLDPSCKVCHQ